MTAEGFRGGKLPGKTAYAGRRRATTRTSGFKVHQDTTGGEFHPQLVETISLQRGDSVTLSFTIAGHKKGDLIGYGLWCWRTSGIDISMTGGYEKKTLTEYGDKSWDKAGSMWAANDDLPVEITLIITAKKAGRVGLYSPICGRVRHKYFDDARAKLMKNMHQFAPEALFISEADEGQVTIDATTDVFGRKRSITLKSCNRCGRYLPVNVPIERDQLSFSNHCVAAHRRPCKHATFGRLRNVADREVVLQLEYGFQLECRFCKKFEVNAAHNPQRTSAQMKEDGARRRAFELLLDSMYGGTPKFRYRHQKGSELTDDTWERFGRACFKCGQDLPTPRDMHLDHTRPLALLWPLDETATALCGSCNSEKRDRAPSDFYTRQKLIELSMRTGLRLEDLETTGPNEAALDLLLSKLDWFFGEFLLRKEMTKERDGKIVGELVVKALQKVLARSERDRGGVDLQKEYERRRKRATQALARSTR